MSYMTHALTRRGVLLLRLCFEIPRERCAKTELSLTSERSGFPRHICHQPSAINVLPLFCKPTTILD
jgi:hypothetical protein